MSDVAFESDTLAQLLGRDPRYPEKAYVFLLLALQRVIGHLDEPRHVSGGELALGCRELAIAWDRKGHAEYATDYRNRASVVVRA